MRFLTAGDSHGEYLVGIIEGFPAGHRISIPAVRRDLQRRRQSYGRSARQKIETDSIQIVSGLWKGLAQKKLGIPVVRISSSRATAEDNLTVGITVTPRAEMTVDAIYVDLVGREVVISGSGTNQTTHRHELHNTRFELQGTQRQLHPGENVELETEVRIPPNAPFTFAADDNVLEWNLTLVISIPKWPDWKQVYPITIGPPRT